MATTFRVHLLSARHKHGIPTLFAFAALAVAYGALLVVLSQGVGTL